MRIRYYQPKTIKSYRNALLGHAKLETTTIYTKVAIVKQRQVVSPLDVLTNRSKVENKLPQRQPPVGRMRSDLAIRTPRMQAGVCNT